MAALHSLYEGKQPYMGADQRVASAAHNVKESLKPPALRPGKAAVLMHILSAKPTTSDIPLVISYIG